MHVFSTLILTIFFAIISAFQAPTVDVAILGAGLSGLSAAKDLANTNRSFIIFETRDRVGGRVSNVLIPNGGSVDVGAEFIGPTQDRVMNLLDSLGLTTFYTYNTGNTTIVRNGTRSTFNGSPTSGDVPLSPEGMLQARQALVQIDQMAAELDVDAPWNHTSAVEWDSQTVQTWSTRVAPHPDAQFLISLAMQSIFSAEQRELSLLYMLAYVAAAGNGTTRGTLERLVDVVDGAQEQRIEGGTHQIPTRLAERLGINNIVLNAPVSAIERRGEAYLISSGTRSVLAQHIVIALSPPLASRINYQPPLPAARDQLTQRMPMGSVGKAVAIYDTPFWRGMGLNGQAVGDVEALGLVFDTSPMNGSFAALTGFIQADSMRRLDVFSEAEIIRELTDDLVRYFGDRASNVSHWVIQRWDREQYSRGGPAAYGPPGVLTSYGPFLREDHQNIHFAGSESSTFWVGYMDGAIRSGERVAAEILRTN
ncbi:hypothetical protein BDV25DRAFT_127853 [Aspergillus avenaceus]|uniref:Amine oxidase n=1 Tax=Aspergillus avenaceus TaxID=36643 RepID=A0A5N6U272_ASPAV|nr:hypothetical protein BDV25DRAFT_127853 [Aspergillus avenaceus]